MRLTVLTFLCVWMAVSHAATPDLSYRFEPDHSQQLLRVVFEQGGRQMGVLPVPGTYADYLRTVPAPKDCIASNQQTTEDYSSYYCKKNQSYVSRLMSRQLGFISEYNNLEQFRIGDFLLDLNEKIYRVQIKDHLISKQFLMDGVVSESFDGRCLMVVAKHGTTEAPTSAFCDNGRHYTYGAGKDGIMGLAPNGVSAVVMTKVDNRSVTRLMSKEGKILYQALPDGAFPHKTKTHIIFYADQEIAPNQSCLVNWDGKNVRCFKFWVGGTEDRLVYSKDGKTCFIGSGFCFTKENAFPDYKTTSSEFITLYKIGGQDAHILCGRKEHCEKVEGVVSADYVGKYAIIQTKHGFGLFGDRQGWVYPASYNKIEIVGDWFFVHHEKGISIYDGRRQRLVKEIR